LFVCHLFLLLLLLLLYLKEKEFEMDYNFEGIEVYVNAVLVIEL